jgi:DNA-binding response OmpR family regulator
MYRYRVMVVDDEPEVLEILQIALREKFDIIPATNGLDALEKIDDFEPDIMVTDVMMPLMNGWELIGEVRKRPAFQEMPVIFLTALNQRKDIAAGYKAGVDLFLTKPFDPLRVRRNIDVFIERTPPPQRARKSSWTDLAKRLAAAPPAAGATPAAERPSPPAAEALPEFDIVPRLLIVDDDEELLHLLTLSFEDRFEVFTAIDGLDAVKKIPSCQPDIFIIDGMLPKMTGFQLCDTLRRSSAHREAPIIFISAKSDPKTRKTMSRFGLVDYLAKPFDAQDLDAVIQKVIRSPGFDPRIKKFTAEEIGKEEMKVKEDQKIRERKKEFQASKSQMKEFIETHQEEGPGEI